MISAFTNTKIKSNISMTGEITLRGDVLPVGGLKEKIIGAKNAGIKKIYVPLDNEKDITTLDKEITSGLKFIYVSNYLQVFDSISFGKRKGKEKEKQNKVLVQKNEK